MGGGPVGVALAVQSGCGAFLRRWSKADELGRISRARNLDDRKVEQLHFMGIVDQLPGGAFPPPGFATVEITTIGNLNGHIFGSRWQAATGP